MKSDPIASSLAGYTLARVPVRTPHDLVALSRRTRAAGDDLGLPADDVRRLSAATYEAARLLATYNDVVAEIRLAEDPSLQVIFRLPVSSERARAGVRRKIESALALVEPLVDRLQVEQTTEGLCVSLRSLLPTGTSQPNETAVSDARISEPSLDVRPTLDTLSERYAALQRDYRDLQAELQETNRGVVAVYTELEGQAERLRQAEDRLRLLLDSVHDYAICMLSPTGEVASWNVGAERLFAYSTEDIIGRSFACFYTEDEREQGVPAEHLREARERGRYEGESVRMRHGGLSFDAHVVLTPVQTNRELRGYSLVVRNITERKRLEDDLRRRAEDLAAANRAKEDFLATLSHELRTPLNAMLGWTRLLRMRKLQGDAAERALETIERNARAQEQLIADILDVSRIVTGKLRLELIPCELAPVVDAALDAVRPAADAKGVQIACDIAWSGAVLGDSDRLQQVLWNLLVNGIKFTPPGGSVSIAVSRVGPTAGITVTDSGEGISEELLPFIFDRFRQGDSSVTRPHGGLGLGLSIVRHIVELHGGKVQAWSAGTGAGSTFSVYLPVHSTRERASASA
ncbi:MAG: PAS domain-containing sensor histidine kinase [Vicinamibacterales bacterium]